jgi:hypothetical protein
MNARMFVAQLWDTVRLWSVGILEMGTSEGDYIEHGTVALASISRINKQWKQISRQCLRSHPRLYPRNRISFSCRGHETPRDERPERLLLRDVGSTIFACRAVRRGSHNPAWTPS